MVLNFILAFIVVFCVGVLTMYQLYCMSKNQTNIEAWERGKVETLIKRGKILPVKYNKESHLCIGVLIHINRLTILSILDFIKISAMY
jgi:hypothetical protein